jgi:hypothetical protein
MPPVEVTQREKRKVMENDRKVATYHSFAQADAETEMGGRYSKVQPVTVTGSNPGAVYPRIDGGPWAKNEMPPEPLVDGRGEGNILGYAIDRPDAALPPANDGGEGRSPKFRRRM